MVSGPVSLTFIDLLNLPKGVLRQVGEDLDLALPPQADKWQLASILARVERGDIESIEPGFLFAGSTSVTFLRLAEPHGDKGQGNGAASLVRQPLTGESIAEDDVRRALNGTVEHDPFDESGRPAEITEKPQLIAARPQQDGTMVLTFAVAKRVTH